VQQKCYSQKIPSGNFFHFSRCYFETRSAVGSFFTYKHRLVNSKYNRKVKSIGFRSYVRPIPQIIQYFFYFCTIYVCVCVCARAHLHSAIFLRNRSRFTDSFLSFVYQRTVVQLTLHASDDSYFVDVVAAQSDHDNNNKVQTKMILEPTSV
jgi:hypothetical protein